jgi:hypothetical protein
MRKFIFILGFAFAGFAMGCSKSGKSSGPSNPDPTGVRNGVTIQVALNAFNGHRAQGVGTTFPATTPLTWSDTLSDAAFKFAQDISAQGAGTLPYTLKNGTSILAYPGLVHFTGTAISGLGYSYPSTYSVQTMVDTDFGLYSTNSAYAPDIRTIMDPTAKVFGMGFYNGSWYIITGHY